MDKPIVAIDDKLSYMRDVLRNEGFDVVDLRHGATQADAVVVSGMDDDLMGIQDRLSDASVIHATGMDAGEIVEQVRRSVGLKE